MFRWFFKVVLPKLQLQARVGLGLCVIVFGIALVGPYLAPYDPNKIHDDGINKVDGTPMPPSDKYLLGTDQLGRDELSRLLDGGKVSLKVALFATAMAMLIGLVIGAMAGYSGGKIDQLTMRFTDIMLSIPFLLLAIALRQAVKSGDLWVLYVLLGSLSWTGLARIVRSKTVQLRELEFVQAARALGYSHRRIIVQHILPNLVGPTLVIATTLAADMVIIESAMSFLGIGVQPPQSSWGSMLRDAQALMTHSPRLVALPGILIVFVVFGFNLLGEGLRDALDPQP